MEFIIPYWKFECSKAAGYNASEVDPTDELRVVNQASLFIGSGEENETEPCIDFDPIIPHFAGDALDPDLVRILSFRVDNGRGKTGQRFDPGCTGSSRSCSWCAKPAP